MRNNLSRRRNRTFCFEIDSMRDLGFVDADGQRFLEPDEYHIMVQGQKAKLEVRE